MNKQRDRLVELVGCACREYSEYTAEMFAEGNYGIESMEEYVADYVLKRGALCPPCKVGQTVYSIDNCINRPEMIVVTAIHQHKTHTLFSALSRSQREYCFEEKDIGKTVFLTKEEAEEALGKKLEKARKKNVIC